MAKQHKKANHLSGACRIVILPHQIPNRKEIA